MPNPNLDLDSVHVELAHTIDDAEKMRTMVLRTSVLALDLLTDAEYALAAGDHKVVEEFIDRARTHLETIRTTVTTTTVAD